MRLIGLLILLGLNSFTVLSQEKYNISGYVRDASNGEELIGAYVSTKNFSVGVSTNVYGFYSLPLEAGTYEIKYSFVGYKTTVKTLEITENQTLDVELVSNNVQVGEATVKGEAENKNVKDIEMSVSEMDIKTISGLPALLGEVDVIRAVQTMPGVTTVGEGATGFNVRGGGIDENLILLDEAPVYNSSHLLGFFSVFNPDAVKNVKLIKGGVPAEYGGRLSSILDVRSKDGNKKEFAGQGGIGLIFSRLTLEGPIVKDKASFIVAGRRSYADVLFKPVLGEDFQDTKFNFFDLTGKLNWRINDNNNVFVSGYRGGDIVGFDFFDFSWGNTTATARWNHIFNNKIFMNLTGVYSDYEYAFNVEEDVNNTFNWKSRIQNVKGKADFSYFANPSNTIKFGISSTYYDFIPAEAKFASGGESNDISLPKKFSFESALFIQNEQKATNKLTLQYGARYSLYNYMGGRDIYTLGEPETVGSAAPIIGVDNSKGKNEVVSTYGNLEPRFAANYSLNDSTAIKLSYNRMAQYLHLLSNTVGASPIDLWTPVTNNLKPSLADQVAIGYFKNLKNNTYEASVEAYYKSTQNIVDYVNGADLFFNDAIETELLEGKARAYGLEFYVKKSKGAYKGWVSYTLSKSERIVDGVSNSEWFNNRYDRPHNFNINISRKLSKRLELSASFTYASGTPSTFPTNRLDVQGWVIPHTYSNERNAFRVPAYHRADLALTIRGDEDPSKKWYGEGVFSFYNLYGRRNPYLFYFQRNEAAPNITEAVQYSVVGSIIPSATYNFKF